MQVNPKIFKAYDIRGIYPGEVNEEVAHLVGAAFARWSKAKEIVVGQDMRTSSPSLTKEVIRGITEQGANVLDIGLASTSTFYFAVRYLKAFAGIQVSASHNPKEYNGFKVVLRDEKGIVKVGGESGLNEIRDLVISGGPSSDASEDGPHSFDGTIQKVDGIQKSEIDAAFKLIPLPKEMSPLTIVADPANAMGIPMLAEIFKRLSNVELIKMNFELDGTFPAHQPDPLQKETLRDLQDRVRKEKADFGIAPDGDADRIFFVDERGEIVPASLITALIAREVLSGGPTAPERSSVRGRQAPALQERSAAPGVPPKVLYDIRYTLNARNAIEKYGGVASVSKVGHAFISKQLRDEDGVFGGESSGHFFFRATGYAEGTPLVLLYVLRALAREKKPFSKVLASLSVAHESGEINFKLEDREKAQVVMRTLEEKYRDGKISKLDGIAVEYPNWRFSVRASNTEPLLRLNIEATTEKMMQLKRDELVSVLNHES